MKKQWLVPLLLAVVAGAAGFGLTGEKAQKVQKINLEAGETENVGCEAMSLNPLRLEAYPELSRTVEEYYAQKEKEEDFIESYDYIQVYTKLGQEKDSYVVFATYKMKIKDIYTETPGLAVFFAKRDGTSGGYKMEQDLAGEGLEEYMAVLSTHEDVQALMKRTNEEYEAAVGSDALLREALQDLRHAYEEQAGND